MPNKKRSAAFAFLTIFLSVVIFSVSAFAATVAIKHKKDGSAYLADSKGMTLYYFKKDSVNKSNCTDECLKQWPIFSPKEFILPAEMKPADLGMITREDGKDQVIYKGYPLYYYVKDKKPGDMLGNKVKDVWFIVDPENFKP